jgi:asparagine synthase (glutamine-hydrolysing)
MAHALECRSPLLDYRVVEFAAALPYEAKMDDAGMGKNILRKILSRYVPASLTDRPKQGFAVPFGRWCSGALGSELRGKWSRVKSPFFSPSAASFLFPENKVGDTTLQWTAFSTMAFLGEI